MLVLVFSFFWVGSRVFWLFLTSAVRLPKFAALGAFGHGVSPPPVFMLLGGSQPPPQILRGFARVSYLPH